MYTNITLNQFIGELQKLAVEHGNESLQSIGACSGKLFGMSAPYCLHLEGNKTLYVPAFAEDVKPLAQACKALPILSGMELPSAEQVEELVGQLRKYSEEEYAQHNNFIAEDLADAAEILSKFVEAKAFATQDFMHESIDELIEDANERSGETGVGNGKELDYEKG